jgi:STIP1 family protein 1
VDAAWQLARLSEIFAERERRRAARAVPDHFICPITVDVMLDPVISPSGTSFERAALLRALAAKAEDPISRKPLKADQLIPNLALKGAIEAWLLENPWAHPLLPPEEREP